MGSTYIQVNHVIQKFKPQTALSPQLETIFLLFDLSYLIIL